MKVRNKKESNQSNRRVLNGTNRQIDETRLPIDAKTGRPIQPGNQPGYYPGFTTLSQQAFWDEATRNVVLDRVENVPPIRFFTPDEAELMQAVCDRVLPQDDRDEAHKIPVMNYIDDRLYHRRIDGYQFEDMPPDHEAHRLGLQAIQEIAQQTYGKAFTELDQTQQDTILKSIHDAKPSGAQDIFCQMSVQHFWMLLVQDVVDAYYAHPYA